MNILPTLITHIFLHIKSNYNIQRLIFTTKKEVKKPVVFRKCYIYRQALSVCQSQVTASASVTINYSSLVHLLN